MDPYYTYMFDEFWVQQFPPNILRRINALEAENREQNRRIRDLERRVRQLERSVFRTREHEEQEDF